MKTFKKLLPLTIAATVAAPAMAEFSANIGASSNYIWRGVSQTMDNAAISGGVDYEHASGFYAGAWVSTVEFGADEEYTDSAGDTVVISGSDSGTETDLYFGFSGEAGGVGYDVGYIYYLYTEFDDVDFGEVYANVSFSILSAGVAYTTNNQKANDDFGFEEGDLHYYLGVGGDLSDGWAAGLTYGYYDFDSDGEVGALESYGYYQADLSKSAGDLGDFTLSMIKAEEESGDDDTKLVVSWSKSF
jgi:uncharacterized protein (TIGR02001 family)